MTSKPRSSYRNTFGNQTAYSTAGSKGYPYSEDPVTATRASYSYSAPGGDASSGFGIGDNRNERDVLKGINNRLATYIDKVRFLEEENERLEKLLREVSDKKDTDLGEDKKNHLQKLREEVDDATLAKVRSEIARDNLQGEASEMKWKLDHERQLRSELDDELAKLRKDVDDATMVRVDLERKIENLKEELEYAKKLHDEEVEDLKDQVKNQGVNVEVDGVAPDISELLRQIREQYEQMVLKNKDDAENWYKNKFDDLQERARTNREEMDKVQNEINDYRKQLTQLEMELESLKGSNEYLERNLDNVENRYELETKRYLTRVNGLANDLDKATTDTKRHLAEYKRLMSTKNSLEKEIVTFRRLLEGDDKKVGSLSRSSSSSSSSSSGGSEDEEPVKPTKKVLVKTIETRDGKIVSSSISEKELVRERSSSSSSSSDED